MMYVAGDGGWLTPELHGVLKRFESVGFEVRRTVRSHEGAVGEWYECRIFQNDAFASAPTPGEAVKEAAAIAAGVA